MPDSYVDAVVGFYIECVLSAWERMHLSNALSHLSSHNKATGKTIKDLDVSIHAIEELTGFNSISVDKLHHHMSMDKD